MSASRRHDAGTPDPGPLAADLQLVSAVDTMVSGVHFLADADPEDVGYKAMAVNASDLAAMGAHPLSAHVAVCARARETAWTNGLRRGVGSAATRFDLPVQSWACTRGSPQIAVAVLGTIPAGAALLRSGARPGELVCVTGTLGDAGLALDVARGRQVVPAHVRASLAPRLTRPVPRLAAGIALRGEATAAIDISDGLVQDLGHVLTASGVGATLDTRRIPLSPALVAAVPRDQALAYALGAGDDYELCFTLPRDRLTAVRAALAGAGCPVTVIGDTDGSGTLRFAGGGAVPRSGFDHFAPETTR